MIELSHDFDVVIPRLGKGMVEPIHAIYSKKCLDTIKTQLESNELEVYAVLKKVSDRYVEQAECRRFDPQLLSFFNINCQADLDQAVVLATKNDYGLRSRQTAKF